MTSRARTIAMAIALTFSALSIAPSYADNPASPGSEGGKQSREQFKKDRDAFEQALRERDAKFRVINLTFKNSVDRSYSDFKTAMAAAITPEQKSSARTSYIAARLAAITARELAIIALGPLPTPPVEPMRSAKIDPRGGSNKSKN